MNESEIRTKANRIDAFIVLLRDRGYTLKQIGTRLGVSGERIRQREFKGRIKAQRLQGQVAANLEFD